MTTPIERAVQTLQEVVLTGRRVLTHDQAEDATHAVFNSIDVDELARVLSANWRNMHTNESLGRQQMLALAVKNWLTGKDQP